MKLSRPALSIVLALFLAGIVLASTAASEPRAERNSFDIYSGHRASIGWTIAARPVDGGIREDIPSKYKDRYEKWKAELLSTPFGREQWDNYANNKAFVLKIVVNGGQKMGAGTDKFVWDDEGQLIGATITLGANIDEGFPNPIYYPVLNSLSLDPRVFPVNGKILAATKISHELGHVNQASVANMKEVQLQNKLMPEYVSIFLNNGLNTGDKKLVDLAEQMGGTPVEIWESREYMSEVNAMLYLNARISKESFYCQVFNKIRWNLQTYAPEYERHFGARQEFSASPCWK